MDWLAVMHRKHPELSPPLSGKATDVLFINHQLQTIHIQNGESFFGIRSFLSSAAEIGLKHTSDFRRAATWTDILQRYEAVAMA